VPLSQPVAVLPTQHADDETDQCPPLAIKADAHVADLEAGVMNHPISSKGKHQGQNGAAELL